MHEKGSICEWLSTESPLNVVLVATFLAQPLTCAYLTVADDNHVTEFAFIGYWTVVSVLCHHFLQLHTAGYCDCCKRHLSPLSEAEQDGYCDCCKRHLSSFFTTEPRGLWISDHCHPYLQFHCWTLGLRLVSNRDWSKWPLSHLFLKFDTIGVRAMHSTYRCHHSLQFHSRGRWPLAVGQ